MASMTATPAFLAAVAKAPTSGRRGAFTVRASKASEGEKAVAKTGDESSNGRRELVFGVAMAAACSIAKIAMADEPKKGTLEARKKYAPICVTMPTAKICHK
nr:photosystem II 5 kDa protein, chloroplastic [Ipomoea batatas]